MPDANRLHAAADEISALLARLHTTATVHARPVEDHGASIEFALNADEPVPAASVIKIPLAVAFARAVVAGALDPVKRIEVPDYLRVGGSGCAGFSDPPLVSLRDLALSMMTVSDNAATDLILAEVGLDAVQALMADLELSETHLRYDMLGGAWQAAWELGLSDPDDLDARVAAANPELVRSLTWLDPTRANATTARDMTTLLHAVWNDTAAPPQACAMVRSMMAQQQNTQRLASGFRDEVRVASKTGTLPTIRNEVGVVTYPDGESYVVAVFTRSPSLGTRNAPVDAAIGRVAATAVDALRA